MSEANLELVREMFGVWREHGLETLLARYHDFFTDDGEWRPPISTVTGAPYVGEGGFRRYLTDLGDIFEDLLGELEEVTEIAPGVARARVKMHGTGRGSGAAIDAPLIAVFRFRDGRIAWAYGTYDLALGERVADALTRGEEPPV